MRLSHLTPAQRKTRANNLYEERGFVYQSTRVDLLDAAGIALAIQRELTTAQVV